MVGQNNGKRKFSKNFLGLLERLFLPKKGGMNFRDLQVFDIVLLAKQAWKIKQNPNSLLARIYKGRDVNSSTFYSRRVQQLLHINGNPYSRERNF